MCLSITQLQLQQAEVLGDGSETMLAVALLTAAYQQLSTAEALPVVDSKLKQGVKELQLEVSKLFYQLHGAATQC